MKKPTPKPKKNPNIELYVVRSGPRRGEPECEAAFKSMPEAVSFLTNLHGLTTDEAKRLAKERALKLDRKWHGAEQCAIRPTEMPPAEARRALSGELYQPKEVTKVWTPRTARSGGRG